MKIGIVGGGLCGLTCGYYLSKKGYQVTIFEKNKNPGGLAAGFKKNSWQWSLEHYPHHLFTSDTQAKNLIRKLNLSKKLFYTRPKTSIFLKNKVFRFDSPLSILTAPHFLLTEKIKASLVTFYLKNSSNWQALEKTTAADWSKKFYGQSVYQKLWQPLLEGKFGTHADQIAMSWLWARIKKRSSRLGYMRGGFETLITQLCREIKNNNGKIHLNHKVKNLRKLKKNFDRLIITIPASEFLKTAPDLPQNYQLKLARLKMIGALNLVLALKENFLKDNTYWLNINQARFPFVFVDEHTNFVPRKFYNNQHLLYVGGYYPQNHRYFKMKKEEIFEEFLPSLKKINPKYNFSRFTIHYSLFTNLHAQPVVPINYSPMIPSHETPLPNVYLANLQQIYPWDRGMNFSIKLGEKLAKIVNRKARHSELASPPSLTWPAHI